ncbi:MAG: hypothetical protein ACLR5S_10665 [Ruminococcus sp.]
MTAGAAHPDLSDRRRRGTHSGIRVVMATAYVQEFDEFYLVCDEKKMFYILPKSALASPAAELPEEASAESGADSEA